MKTQFPKDIYNAFGLSIRRIMHETVWCDDKKSDNIPSFVDMVPPYSKKTMKTL